MAAQGIYAHRHWRQWYESDGVDELLRTLIIRQTFKRWCGVEDVDFLYVDGVSMGDDSPDKRALAAAKLDEVRALAASLV